jgi:hypothetical protein
VGGLIVAAVAGASFLAGRASHPDRGATTTNGSATATTSGGHPPIQSVCDHIGLYREGTETSDELGYQMTVTNAGPTFVTVSGFIVVFTGGTKETGSDRETVTPAYLNPGASITWTPTPGNGPWDNAQFSGEIPDTGGSCQVVSVEATSSGG